MADTTDTRHPLLRVPDTIALGAFAVIAVAVTVIALIESYTNLYEFFTAHGLGGWRASIAPLCVDAFMVMGECQLFAAFARRWGIAYQSPGWLMAVCGFGVSVACNVEHVPQASIADRLVSAIFPVTAAAGLAGGLVIVKLVTDRHRSRPKLPAAVRNRPQTSARKAHAASGARVQRPASVPQPGDPQPSAVREAVAAGMTHRDMAAEWDITRWRVAALTQPGSYAMNGHMED